LLKYAWENTPVGSGLRRYLVDRCGWKLRGELGFTDQHSHMFTIEICLAIMRAMYVCRISRPTDDPTLDVNNYDEPEAEDKK